MKSVTTLSTLALLSLIELASAANFTLVKDFSGKTFFDDWQFYGNYDNLTNGAVNYVTQAQSSNLAFVNSAGHAVIKVDNESFVPYPDKRNSVRISSNDYFELGTLFVFDAVHLPYGCSVWPGIWTKGNDWPANGEIDIVEGINMVTSNQMALHTFAGCNAASGTNAINQPTITSCNDTTSSGCTVPEKQPNNYGAAFAQNGGGVYAMQFDASGIFIWFWTRSAVPAAISTATDSIDLSTFGPPSAAYPSQSCNIAEFFGPQQIVLDITLCGDWAGVPSIFTQTCAGNSTDPNTCYVGYVINNGTSDLADGYFEFNSIRAFGVNSSVVVGSDGTSASNSSSGSSSPSSGSGSGSGSGSSSSGGSGTSGASVVSPRALYAGAAAAAFFSWLLL